MGADQIGYLFKGPARLDLTAETRRKAILRGREVIAAIHALKPGLPLPPAIRHLDLEDAEMLREDQYQLPDPARFVRDLIRWWRDGARDTCIGPDPDDPTQVFGFAGELSWGDEPSGHGFRLVQDGYRLDILDIFGIRGPGSPPPSVVSNRQAIQWGDHLQSAVDAWPHFDEDRDVSGADLVEWFILWRRRARHLLSGRPPHRS